ncbi:MAG: SEL1-like repeat protein, partial [Rhodomicrobiaceae bacterium]
PRDRAQRGGDTSREAPRASFEPSSSDAGIDVREPRQGSAHKVTPNIPVLDRGWFEERFATMRASIDRLAENIPAQRLDALETQFHQLMEKLGAREKDRSVAAVEAGLKKLAAYLEDNKQWTNAQDARVRGVEERLDQLSGLVAQSHAALSATAKGLEIVARGTGPQLARQTADLVTQQLEPRIDALDATAPISRLSGEVASLSAHSAQLARNTNERLKQLQLCLDDSLERLADVEKDQRGVNSNVGQRAFNDDNYDDADDYDDTPGGAAQRAARLARETARGAAPQSGEPVRSRIPYGEFLPEDERSHSRIGLIVAAIILLLASAAMLYLNLRDKTHGGSLSNAWFSSSMPERSRAEAAPSPTTTSSIGTKTSDRISLTAPGVSVTDGVWVTSVKADEIAKTPASKEGGPGALAAAEPFDPQTTGQADTSPAIAASHKTDSLSRAAVEGDANAQFSVGETYLEGGDIERQLTIGERLSKAARWFRRAAENGHAPSQYRLATLYELGQGAPKDPAEAMRWYQRAAENGHIKAMHNLAVLSITGNGRSSNYLTAAKWFTAAAEHGLRDSQYNLGILYERGLGVAKSPEQAYLWFTLAAKQGDAKAVQKRDELAGELTTAELQDAELQAAKWTPAKTDEAANDKAPEPPVEQAQHVEPAILPKAPDAQLMKASWTTEVAPVDSIVAEAQRLLRKLGYQPGPVDGILGPRTLAAIRTFEQKAGIPSRGRVTQTLVAKMAFAL